MRELYVSLPEREGQAERRIIIAFAHPWKRSKLRGTEGFFRATTCSIGQVIKDRVKDTKGKYRFYSFAEVKWPLQASVVDGKLLKNHSWVVTPELSAAAAATLANLRQLLPTGISLNLHKHPKLSKTEAAKFALKKALSLSKDVFTYEEGKEIWKEFHTEFHTGVVNSEPPTPAAPVQEESIKVPARVLAFVSPHPGIFLAPDKWPVGTTVH